jgi:hypothetical protein
MLSIKTLTLQTCMWWWRKVMKAPV